VPNLSLQDQTTEFLLYTAPNGQIKVEVLLGNETLWLTQKRMAELFGVGVPAISKHLKNIFGSGELQEELVISILETTTEHGAVAALTQTQQVKYYNLDAVISVGYLSFCCSCFSSPLFKPTACVRHNGLPLDCV
jgi:hypothetical protein